MEITEKEIQILKHTTGLSRGPKPSRNYFASEESGTDYDTIQGLVEKGLMAGGRRHPLNEDLLNYWVTSEGFKAIGSDIDFLKD